MSSDAEKKEMTKEEIAKKYKDYYEKLNSIYPVRDFEIPGKDGQPIYFHRSNQVDHPSYLIYFLRDKGFKEFQEKIDELNLKGEPIDGESYEIPKEYDPKAHILIRKDKKVFSFLIEWDHMGKGYATSIYNNYLNILDMLGIEDKENYELRIGTQANHIFLQEMRAKELVARTHCEPNNENAKKIIEDFLNHAKPIKINYINTIIDYAIKSDVSKDEIANALNKNGFNLMILTSNNPFERYSKYGKSMDEFKSFNITGIKPTCMHHHFIKNKDFRYMQLLTNPDEEDSSLEFKRIYEYVKENYKKQKEENYEYINSNLQEFGELEHIILDWNYCGLLFKHINPDLQKIVKECAISNFDKFDSEHKASWHYTADSNSVKTFKMLQDAGLMDKETYISLYQRALNRNYDFEEFDEVAHSFITYEERRKAIEEVNQNIYYPAPRENWQKSSCWQKKKEHQIPKIHLPIELSKKENIRDIIKQEVLRQGTAKRTKIITSMTGIDKDGKHFPVENLKDWLFGVPGAHGNLQISKNDIITFPPQTPQYAVEFIQKTLSELEHSGYNEEYDER